MLSDLSSVLPLRMARAPDASARSHEATQRYRRHVDAAASFLQSEVGSVPRVGVVINAEFGSLGEELPLESVCRFRDVPHFPTASDGAVEGHVRRGQFGTTEFLLLDGMLPLYAGYTPREAVFPVRMMGEAGIETLLFVTPAGSVASEIGPSDLVLVTDHINFQGVNPLVGPNVDEWGPRFPDMSEPYDPELRTVAERVAVEQGIRLEKGIMMATLGPNFGTPAEYGMVRTLGADVVGMSTIPEVIAARHMDVTVMTLAVVTDDCSPDALAPVSADDIALAMDAGRPRVRSLVEGVVRRVGGDA